jgi:tripartite-type tricarboxylate transporter receptor subunit TctC
MSWRRRTIGQWLGLAALSDGGVAQAQEIDRWPQRPLQLIVVYPPGGVGDAAARALALGLKSLLGAAVIVQNRAGAGGWIGLDALTRAAPDGRTLAFSAISPLTLNPLVGSHLPDLEARVIPVASVMRTPVLILGTPAFKGRTFSDLIEQARRYPGGMRWATSGVGTTGHLVMANIAHQSRSAVVHVAYRGGGQPLNDALGGQFEVLSTNLGALQLQYVNKGRLKALAVGAPTRLPALPQVPTLFELGFASANLDSLFGVFAPANTPPQRVERLNRTINQVLKTASFQVGLNSSFGLQAGGESAVEFRRTIAQERAKYEAMMRRNPDLLK